MSETACGHVQHYQNDNTYFSASRLSVVSVAGSWKICQTSLEVFLH